MQTFNQIIDNLKAIISSTKDKDIAIALNIKPVTFASYKCRNKPPYKAILTYCHENRIDVRKILFNEDAPVIAYPAPIPLEAGKVQVRYFRTPILITNAISPQSSS